MRCDAPPDMPPSRAASLPTCLPPDNTIPYNKFTSQVAARSNSQSLITYLTVHSQTVVSAPSVRKMPRRERVCRKCGAVKKIWLMEGIGPMPQKYQCRKGLGGCAVEPEPEPRIPKRTNVKRQSRQMAKAPKSPKSAKSGVAFILIMGFAHTAAKSAPKA